MVRKRIRTVESVKNVVLASERVARLLRGQSAAQPVKRNVVAAALKLHPRTLQRRLKDEGLTFEIVRDNVLRTRAEKLLAQDSGRLCDLSERLGYANPASFSHACRRWFGMSPSKKRRMLLQEAKRTTKR